ncbi:hypothetical protein K474DRAFT_1707531 [Panus rudis PR-1116 ss-1]|nr:hypothetical protein K474DRAFT_1707531 [Panus rudis PR-1116 ss-1]
MFFILQALIRDAPRVDSLVIPRGGFLEEIEWSSPHGEGPVGYASLQLLKCVFVFGPPNAPLPRYQFPDPASVMMLHQKLSLASVLALLVAGASADKPYTTPELCVQACYAAIADLTFGDYDPSQTYVGMRCASRLAVSSVYACYDLRCSSQYSVDESFGHLQAYCEEYGYLPINGTYSDVIQDVLAQYGSISNVPVIDPATVPLTEIVNNTVIASDDYYDLTYRTLEVWQHQMHMHHTFGWSMYVLAGGIVFFGVVNRLMAFLVHRLLSNGPLPVDAEHSAAIVGKGTSPNTGLFNKVHNLCAKYILLPATFGYRHIQPWGWCTIPTRLQSILIFIYFALNFIFCAIDWRLFPGNVYWTDTASQFWRYFADRTGIMSFANLPLVWLFAGRNDILLWLTGWSFSTFNVFHRYAARIATVQGILHSIAYTVIYYQSPGGYSDVLSEQWFWTGLAATVLMSLLLGFSILPLRVKVYEVFLAIHISFSLVILIYLFLHVKIMDGEYDAWLWACTAFWVADRGLRLIRLLVLNYRVFVPGKNDPLKRSQATAVYDPEGDIIRLTVRPSINFLVGAGIHYYIYTPTASAFCLWENHPFTLGSWSSVSLPNDTPALEPTLPASPTAVAHSPDGSDSKSFSSDGRDVQMHPTQQELMFLIRPYKGMTNKLKKQLLKAPGYTKDLRVLIEGPYGVPVDLKQYERTLMIAGGSGVTGILAYVYEFERYARKGAAAGRHLRFVWAAREPRFIADVVEKDLAQFVGRSDTHMDLYMTRGAENDKGAIVEKALARASKPEKAGSNATFLSGRPDIAALLDQEIEQLVSPGSRLAVVVCGPGRLADDVRYEVVHAIGNKIDASRIELYEESFGW